ncbi:MAG: site-specific integrase [Oligoflexia bacterium]|nr:site-specific integrase [Oligoflexia bacterium]
MKNKGKNSFRAEKKIRGIRYSKNFSSKEAADEWLLNLEKNFVTKHNGSNKSVKRMTVKQMLVRLVEVEAKKDIDPRTVDAYLETIPHFDPINNICVSKLTVKQLVDCFKKIRNRLNGEILSKSRMYKFLGRFTRALNIAARRGVFMKNFEDAEAEIVGYIKNNGKDERTNPPYTGEELELLLNYVAPAKKEPWWVLPLIKVYLYSGKRLGEIIGLTNDKINLKSKEIEINSMVSGRMYHDHLKSHAKPHKVEMDDDLYKVICEIQEQNKIHRPGSDWLFPPIHYRGRPDFKKGKHKCPYKGQPILDSSVRKFIKERMEKSGAGKKKIHDLRSVYATLRLFQLLKEGNVLAREIVQAELNHKSYKTTEKYIRFADELMNNGHKRNVISSFFSSLEPKQVSTAVDVNEELRKRGINPEEIDWELFYNLLLSFINGMKKAA